MGCFLAVEEPGLEARPADHHLSFAVAVESDWASVGNETGGKTERKWEKINFWFDHSVAQTQTQIFSQSDLQIKKFM